MNLRVGTRVFYTTSRWPDVEEADDRTPANAQTYIQQAHVAELEWTPRGRLLVRMIDAAGRPLVMTRRELAMNEGCNG
jgi:hypothetical protein